MFLVIGTQISIFVVLARPMNFFCSILPLFIAICTTLIGAISLLYTINKKNRYQMTSFRLSWWLGHHHRPHRSTFPFHRRKKSRSNKKVNVKTFHRMIHIQQRLTFRSLKCNINQRKWTKKKENKKKSVSGFSLIFFCFLFRRINDARWPRRQSLSDFTS